MPNYHYSAFGGPRNIYYSNVIYLDDYVETTEDYNRAISAIGRDIKVFSPDFVVLSLTLLEKPQDDSRFRYALADAIEYLEKIGAPSPSGADEKATRKAQADHARILKRLKRTL